MHVGNMSGIRQKLVKINVPLSSESIFNHCFNAKKTFFFRRNPEEKGKSEEISDQQFLQTTSAWSVPVCVSCGKTVWSSTGTYLWGGQWAAQAHLCKLLHRNLIYLVLLWCLISTSVWLLEFAVLKPGKELLIIHPV